MTEDQAKTTSEPSATFTPGPWAQSHRKTGDDAYWTQVYRASDPTYEIASLHWAPRDLGAGHITSDREANARLIASAPDLLEALREAELQVEYLHEKFMRTGSGETILAKIRAAITKATGDAS